jgi:hypothetical protein
MLQLQLLQIRRHALQLTHIEKVLYYYRYCQLLIVYAELRGLHINAAPSGKRIRLSLDCAALYVVTVRYISCACKVRTTSRRKR